MNKVENITIEDYRLAHAEGNLKKLDYIEKNVSNFKLEVWANAILRGEN